MNVSLIRVFRLRGYFLNFSPADVIKIECQVLIQGYFLQNDSDDMYYTRN